MIDRYRKRLQGDGVRAILARGATGAFAVKVIGTGIAFGVHVFLARTLGADSFGIYIYVLTLMTLIALVGQCGMNTASVRLVADYNASESWALMRGFIRRSQQIPLAVSLLLSAFAAFGIWLAQDKLGVEFARTAWIATILLSLQVILSVRRSYLNAYKKVVLATFPQQILRPLILGLTVFIFATIYEEKVDAVSAMGAQLLATTVALLLTSWYLRDLFPEQIWKVRPRYENKEWMRIAMSLMLVSGYGVILAHIDTVMIGMFLGTTKAGIYSAAVKVSSLISFGLMAIATMSAPMISELYTQGKKDELQKMITFASLGLTAFSVPVALVVIVWGEWILSLFGPSFTAGYLALVILSVGQIVNALAGTVVIFMIMTGHEADYLRMMLKVVVSNIALNAILIPLFGLEGAAVASAFTLASLNIILVIHIRRSFGINTVIIGHG